MKKILHKSLMTTMACALAVTSHPLSVISATSNTTTFTDTKNHWGESYISTVVDADLMVGTDTGVFAPDKAMTYGEFAVVATNGRFYGDSWAKDTDVHWADPYLNFMIDFGYFETSTGVSLVPNTSNWQNLEMPRYAMVSAIARMIESPNSTVNTSVVSQYSDITSFNKDYLDDFALVVESGIMSGVSSTQFGVSDSVTRAAVCVVVNNMLEKGLMKSLTEDYVGDVADSPSTGTTTTPAPSTSTGTTTTTPSVGTTTTTPSTSTGTTTTTPSTTTTVKPTTAPGTAPVIGIGFLGSWAEKPDDVVAGSGQYDVNQYTVPADTNKDGWITYGEVATVWDSIYEQYPHKSSWDDSRTYTSNVYWTDGVATTKNTSGCAAFATMCSDLIFGNLPSRRVVGDASIDPTEQVRPGDVYYNKNMIHWKIVGGDAYMEGYNMSGRMISYGGNENNMVMYGVFSEYTEAQSSIISGNTTNTFFWFTRYPAA